MFRGARKVSLDIQEDGRIELMRINEDGSTSFSYHDGVDEALIVSGMLLKRGREVVLKQKFTPQLFKDAKKAYKELEANRKWQQKTRM